jgi:hypothetical protein
MKPMILLLLICLLSLLSKTNEPARWRETSAAWSCWTNSGKEMTIPNLAP